MNTIKTKTLFNIKGGHFLGLGFGSIADSTADAVCVSAFSEKHFASNTAIGAIDRLFVQGALPQAWGAAERRPGNCSLIQTQTLPRRSGSSPQMHYLLVVCMGGYESFLKGAQVSTLIQQGLHCAAELLRNRPGITQLDLTALGTQYGGVAKRQVFEWVADWSQNVFQSVPTLNAVRFVSNDLDTFIELFEAISRMQNWSGKDLRFTNPSGDGNADVLRRALREIEIIPTATTIEAYETLKRDISSAARLLDQNPKAVLLLCRAVVEAIVHRLCEVRSMVSAGGLFEEIQQLHQAKAIPTQINSFLHTCRVLGNFANHDQEGFHPTFRDAELVMLLTLRVCEWYLKLKGPDGQPNHRPHR